MKASLHKLVHALKLLIWRQLFGDAQDCGLAVGSMSPGASAMVSRHHVLRSLQNCKPKQALPSIS